MTTGPLVACSSAPWPGRGRSAHGHPGASSLFHVLLPGVLSRAGCAIMPSFLVSVSTGGRRPGRRCRGSGTRGGGAYGWPSASPRRHRRGCAYSIPRASRRQRACAGRPPRLLGVRVVAEGPLDAPWLTILWHPDHRGQRLLAASSTTLWWNAVVIRPKVSGFPMPSRSWSRAAARCCGPRRCALGNTAGGGGPTIVPRLVHVLQGGAVSVSSMPNWAAAASGPGM